MPSTCQKKTNHHFRSLQFYLNSLLHLVLDFHMLLKKKKRSLLLQFPPLTLLPSSSQSSTVVPQTGADG